MHITPPWQVETIFLNAEQLYCRPSATPDKSSNFLRKLGALCPLPMLPAGANPAQEARSIIKQVSVEGEGRGLVESRFFLQVSQQADLEQITLQSNWKGSAAPKTWYYYCNVGAS